jgi:hypothetical protein
VQKTRDSGNTGTFATIAIIAAVGSFVLTFIGSPVIGLLAAFVALPLGIIGLVKAASPKVGGGILSIVAIVLGIFGLGIAVLGIVGAILF